MSPLFSPMTMASARKASKPTFGACHQPFGHDIWRIVKLWRFQTYKGSNREIRSALAQVSSMFGEDTRTVFGQKFPRNPQLHVYAGDYCESTQAHAQDDGKDLRQSQWPRSDDLNHHHDDSRLSTAGFHSQTVAVVWRSLVAGWPEETHADLTGRKEVVFSFKRVESGAEGRGSEKRSKELYGARNIRLKWSRTNDEETWWKLTCAMLRHPY